jgi:activator of HSP90 ATPase
MNRRNWLPMTTNVLTRRQLAASAGTLVGFAAAPTWTEAAAESDISRTTESIHQELVFHAPRRRIYEALIDAGQFRKIEQLGAAVQSGVAAGKRPTEISPQVGGPFTLFGGHIMGRHIELVPYQRIVQAWHVVDWHPGTYPIVKLELTENESSTTIVFDHTGFPEGQAQHLAEGWTANYWGPLRKYLTL